MEHALTTEEICKKLRPVFGDKIGQIYLKYKLCDKIESKMEIEQALHSLYHKYLNKGLLDDDILLEPPKEGQVAGEYPLGLVTYAKKDLHSFCLREKDWPRHVCISGMSGSGKTTFAFQILGNFILKKKPFVAFDWKKSFRQLMNVNKSLHCFTVGNERVSNHFKLNINQPPRNVGAKEWINILCDLINDAFFASFGVHKLLRETLDQAFKDFGVYEGSENYPTWRQIKDRLEEMDADMHGKRGRESEWLESALRIASSLTYGDFGEAINHKGETMFTVDDLLDKQVVFELHNLGASEKKFFASFFLTYVYKLMKTNNYESDGFKLAIVVDEAHNIFLKEKPNFLNESITDMIYREIREYGVSLICLDQHISKLSDTVAGNSACNIAFQQILPADVECVSSLMQIRDHRKFFSMLPVGHAIVKMADRYYNPFLIKAPFIELKKSILTDDQLRDLMKEHVTFQKRVKYFKQACDVTNIKKELEKLDTTFKVSRVETNGDLGAMQQMKEQNSRLVSESKAPVSFSYELTQQQQQFLATIQSQKLSPMGTTQIYRQLKSSIRKGNELKCQLIDLGLISEEVERHEKGWIKHLVLTPSGASYLSENPEIRGNVISN
ncbi:ATP-binding protein [Candidatus Woesearchaeota archaeon]|nr:ATP-binding protein [Candidatus Woesearchaeota archaeon]